VQVSVTSKPRVPQFATVSNPERTARVRDVAFERLYATHSRPLYHFFLYRTSDRALAEDLVAETFERALRARKRFDFRKGSEASWLYAIAVNRLRDHIRRDQVEERRVQGAGQEAERRASEQFNQAGEAGLQSVETKLDTLEALKLLEPDEREAIALRYGADLTLAETARVTGERVSTAQGRIYRGLRKLREALD
jgi:RNA polymerase sigma factor (sigma-70 family)